MASNVTLFAVRLRTNLVKVPLAVAGVVVGCLSSVHQNQTTGTLLVDPYWTTFYLANLRDGFRRRALVGTICRLFFPHGLNVLVINAIALAALLVCLTMFVRAVLRLSRRRANFASELLLFALCASALTGVFSEVIGDPLQITLVLFLLMATVLPHLREEGARLLLGLAVAVVSFFVHEASIFLLLPALPFFVKAELRPRDFVVPLAFEAMLLGTALLWSDTAAHLTYGLLLYPHGYSQMLPYTPPFGYLLRQEYAVDFGSWGLFLAFCERTARILLLGLAGVAALSVLLPVRTLGRVLQRLVFLLVMSVPLWIVAHDWGRFLAYSLLLAITAVAQWPELAEKAGRLDTIAAWLAARMRSYGLVMAVAFVLYCSPDKYSRVEGMSGYIAEDFGLMLLGFGVYHLWKDVLARKAAEVLLRGANSGGNGL